MKNWFFMSFSPLKPYSVWCRMTFFWWFKGHSVQRVTPVRQSQTRWKKRQKNNVFFQISKKTGFWLLRALSVFSVWYSLYRCAMFLTIYVRYPDWHSKKNGIKKRYFQAIQSPDSKVFKKFVTFFGHFLVFFCFFDVFRNMYTAVALRKWIDSISVMLWVIRNNQIDNALYF